METTIAITALAALAQETRLSIFRALVRAGPDGLPAGAIADAVGAPASTLSFHLKELANAGLIASRQEGRFVFYFAQYPAMSELVAFLTENCCQGMPARNVARIGQAVAACCAPETQPKKHRRNS
ncbi:MAG TPA: metalloregulator ArsR/SmtB family transcription factor [Usitatibacter sp.]|nr:metalloregulator ArsR/SmtB family transcription factor [Usitatibacter sp.]